MFSVSDILKSAGEKTILVVGDCMIDAYDFCYTEHSRPSPERPDKLVYTAHRIERMLGGAGNVAANLASLGVQTLFLTVCGEDGNAVEIERHCDDAAVKHLLVRDDSRPTPIKTRLYIDDAYVLRRDDEKTHKISAAVSARLVERFSEVVDRVDAVILSDYNKGVFTAENAQLMIRQCRDKNVPVVVDLKPPNASIFSGATIVAPNLKEAKAIYADFDPYQKEGALNELHSLLGSEKVVVTLGADGMLAYDENQCAHVKGRTVKAVDPCGCGDTVRACLTLGMVSGLDIEAAADFANYAASLVVQKLGTAALSPEELLQGTVK